jgi:predicted dehydrogenase
MNTKAILRLGVLGLTHDHVWGNLDDLTRLPGVRLVAAADSHRPLLRRVRERFGCAAWTDAAALLRAEPLDAVFIFAENALHPELTVLAARHGLHVLVEKPMAADLAGARRMQAAASRAGVRLMVNWPVAWWPQMQTAFALIAAGRIGRIWQVKYRAAHAGPRAMGCSKWFCDWLYDPARNGAGALVDYCCYGAALSCALLGPPRRVTGFARRLGPRNTGVEDNALLVMEHPGALSLAEASWTQVGDLTSYVTMIYGSKGTLVVEPPPGNRLLLATKQAPAGVEVKLHRQPAHLRSASAHFVHALRSGADFFPLCRAEVALQAQGALEAGLRSAAMRPTSPR